MNSDVSKALDDYYDNYSDYRNQFIKYLTMEQEKFGYHWNSAFSKLLRNLATKHDKSEFMWQVDDFMKRKLNETNNDEFEAAINNYKQKKGDYNVSGYYLFLFCLFCFNPFFAIIVIVLVYLWKNDPFGWKANVLHPNGINNDEVVQD